MDMWTQLLVLVCLVFAVYVYVNRKKCASVTAKMWQRMIGMPNHAQLQNSKNRSAAWKSAAAGDEYTAFRAAGGDPVDWASITRGCSEEDLH